MLQTIESFNVLPLVDKMKLLFIFELGFKGIASKMAMTMTIIIIVVVVIRIIIIIMCCMKSYNAKELFSYSIKKRLDWVGE